MTARSTSIVALCLLLAGGCAFQSYQAVRAAREAYDSCVATQSAQHDACVALEEQLRVEEERYRVESRTAWGCSPGDPECPVER